MPCVWLDFNPSIHLIADCSHAGFEGRPLARRSLKMSGVPGPSSSFEALRWARRTLLQLEKHGDALGEPLTERLFERLNRVSLTTAFSGMGGAEESLRHLMESLAESGWPRVNIEVLEAIEIDRHARAVLGGHAEEVRPRHVFDDIRVMVPRDILESVLTLLVQSGSGNGEDGKEQPTVPDDWTKVV